MNEKIKRNRVKKPSLDSSAQSRITKHSSKVKQEVSWVKQEFPEMPSLKEEIQPKFVDFPTIYIKSNSNFKNVTCESVEVKEINIKKEEALCDSNEHHERKCIESDDDGKLLNDGTDFKIPFQCKFCDYKSLQQLNIQRHLNIHRAKKLLQCKQCDFKSSWKESLRRHMKSHALTKLIQCEFCPYNTFRPKRLQRHMKRHRPANYKCQVCDYKTTEVANLRQHMRKHTGEKPFQCNQCSYKSAQKSNLKKHVRIHTGEKPFQCSVCGYCGSEKRTLDAHIRTHTGEKPFHCTKCAYRSGRKNNLIRHMKIHTLI